MLIQNDHGYILGTKKYPPLMSQALYLMIFPLEGPETKKNEARQEQNKLKIMKFPSNPISGSEIDPGASTR